jgi:hypothetical protein
MAHALCLLDNWGYRTQNMAHALCLFDNWGYRTQNMYSLRPVNGNHGFVNALQFYVIFTLRRLVTKKIHFLNVVWANDCCYCANHSARAKTLCRQDVNFLTLHYVVVHTFKQ